MCIVSFVQTEQSYIITFNRDEDPERSFTNPRKDSESGIFSPMDTIGGGTWIGCTVDYVMCLQNGGKKKHKRQTPYEQSRGVLLLELLKGASLDKMIKSLEHIKTEPFTLSVFDRKSNTLHIYTYDGTSVFTESISTKLPHIICSSTLYDADAFEKIQSDFVHLHPDSPEFLLEFHLTYVVNSHKNTFVHQAVKTTSITQLALKNQEAECVFFNLMNGEIKTYTID